MAGTETEGIGEPQAGLELDPQSVAPGQVLHIRFTGPPGGVATAEFVPLSTPAADVGHEHEGPGG